MSARSAMSDTGGDRASEEEGISVCRYSMRSSISQIAQKPLYYWLVKSETQLQKCDDHYFSFRVHHSKKYKLISDHVML